ncbi:bifunctional (p)ppGpp synthetase/guanosine-3',5'-bis(diphosphate) 3'-pyrophosphohydrolase [Anaerolineales bacterium]
MPTATYSHDLESLLSMMPDLSAHDQSLIERAYAKAEKAHDGQIRKSGEPFFTHCVAVASILADMKMDAETIAAALLHDIVEDTDLELAELRNEFGTSIAQIVDGVTKLAHLPLPLAQTNERHKKSSSLVSKEKEYFRKMFLSMDNDIRVVIVKLADRLHNMRTLGYMSAEKQVNTAQETLDIFAPLANRLGIWQIKWELEDLAFRYIDPVSYRAIASSLDERRDDRMAYVAKVADRLKEELRKNDITDVTITARPKHIYSIYRKMKRKGIPLEQVYDVRAVRVIVQELSQCYLVLGIVHNMYHPLPGEFDDYIANAKDNFYQSLHTSVMDRDSGKTIEVQIRTREMHEKAEYGIAAHWRYKEGIKDGKDKDFEDRIAYLRRLMEFGNEGHEDADEFMTTMKSEVFEDRVYAFTPKGDIVDLPIGATPVDFAYHIHTEIGHRCRGAKIHGRLVQLNYKLKTGDQVDILTAKRGGPSMDWLNEDLGYVKTNRAKTKIRHWLKRQNREKHIAMGREGLERELKRLGVSDRLSFDSVAHLFEIDKIDDFLVAIGAGDINGAQITHRILEDERRRQRAAEFEAEILKPSGKSNINGENTGVSIMGTGGLLTNLAKCCNPMIGDAIIGYVTRGRGVTVHRADCSNMNNLKDSERLIDVSWGSSNNEQLFAVPVIALAHDREGLLRDISTVIADEGVNISSVEVVRRQHIVTIYLMVEIRNNHQLTRILNRIEGIPSIVEANRRKMV